MVGSNDKKCVNVRKDKYIPYMLWLLLPPTHVAQQDPARQVHLRSDWDVNKDFATLPGSYAKKHFANFQSIS